MVGEVAPRGLSMQVRREHPTRALTLHPYTVDNLVKEASLAFRQLRKYQVAQSKVIRFLLALHDLALAGALVSQVVRRHIHLPLVVQALLAALDECLTAGTNQTIPPRSVSIGGKWHPCLTAHQRGRHLCFCKLTREVIALHCPCRRRQQEEKARKDTPQCGIPAHRVRRVFHSINSVCGIISVSLPCKDTSFFSYVQVSMPHRI